jgi:predicted Zn-dependent protease
LAFASGDGLAQISVSVMQPQNGMPLAQFMDALHDEVVRKLAADPANGWQSIEDRRQTVGGMAFRFRTFRATHGAATGMELGFTFARSASHGVVFNVPMAPQGQARHAAAVRRSLLSLRPPAAVNAPAGGASGGRMAPLVGMRGQGQAPSPLVGVRTGGQSSAGATTGGPPALAGVRGGSGTASTPIASSRGKSMKDMTNMEELKKLEALLMPLVEADPYGPQREELATLRAGMGMLCYEQGDVRQAVDYLVNAVQLDAAKADVLELLGDVLDDLPEPQAPYLAQSYYEDALELDPANRACRLKLAGLYMSTGEFDDARVHYEILTRNAPGRPDPAYAQDLALCYLSLNRTAEAVRFFDEMVRVGNDARLRSFLAIFLNRQGDTRAAMAQAQQVAASADAELASYGKRLLADFRSGKGGN